MVAEVMLQQTQVARVIPKYCEFIARYPTIYQLAHASAADILRIWKGMGYNRRALYLHHAAKMLVEQYHGIFPKTETELSKLPGLGTYTARAILVFAYKQNIACVDTNIRQIITHFFFNDKLQKPSVIQSVADQLLPIGKSWEWHQALMDYGAINTLKARRKTRQAKITTERFTESNRFIRGKIIDALRVRAYERTRLMNIVSQTTGKPKTRVDRLITSLKQEGLLVEEAGKISLPQ